MNETDRMPIVLSGKDFGLPSDIPVTDFTLHIDVTAEGARSVDLHAYTWHESGTPDTEPDPDRNDAVFISGLNSDAHDYISAVHSMKSHHKHMTFIAHTDAAGSKQDKPEVPFNNESFAPSGEAFLLSIEQLVETGEIKAGVTVYTHSTGAAVCLEAIALDEKRSREQSKPRLIKQAVLVAPAGITEIGDTAAVNAALTETMKQAFAEEWHRAKADRSNNWNAGEALVRILKRQYSGEYSEARDFGTFLRDVIKNARTEGWSSVIAENTVIEFVEYIFENFAILEDTHYRFNLYWPDMLPHAWPKTKSALHNIELITTNITERPRSEIRDTPISLVFFDEDRLVRMKNLLSDADTDDIEGTVLTEQELSTIRMQGSRLIGMYDRRRKINPSLSYADFQDEVYSLLTSFKRGDRERRLIELRAKDLFPQNKDNITAEYISFTHHMSQRRHAGDIMSLASRIFGI